MSRCKEDVIEMIDKALDANYCNNTCECHGLSVQGERCCYCKIKEALQMSRSCIIASVTHIEAMKQRMLAAQHDIERRIKTLLEA